MIHKIMGCVNCPLYDCTGDEYGEYCHHPNKKTVQRIWEGGKSVDLTFPVTLIDGLYTTEHDGAKYSVSISTDDVAIEKDNDGNPITPDWCPVKKDSITIEY